VISDKGGPRLDETFWRTAGDELIRNTLECFLLAKAPVNLDNLCSFIYHAPTSPKSAADGSWQTSPNFGPCFLKAKASINDADDERMFGILEEYWLTQYPRLNPNTRSCITAAFSALVSTLRTRGIYDLLSTITTITPESIFSGRIIILDLPINELEDAGLLVQAAWKYLVQRAALRRGDLGRGVHCRPIFVWEDECQNTLIDFDTKFLPVSREYRVANVRMSQNLSNFYARFGGGEYAREKVNAIIGSLNTRIFHANGDMNTNKLAAEYIGTDYRTIVNRSTTPSQYNGFNPFMGMLHPILNPPTVTYNENHVREAIIHPEEFATMPIGSAQNGFMTAVVITQVGRLFKDGGNFKFAWMPQVAPGHYPPPPPP